MKNTEPGAKAGAWKQMASELLPMNVADEQ